MLDFLENTDNYPTEMEVWQVAAILGCTKDTVRRYIRQGKIGYVVISRKYLIPKDALMKYISENVKFSL